MEMKLGWLLKMRETRDQLSYNPWPYKCKEYYEFENSRKKIKRKKPQNQIDDEKRYGGSVKKFWEYNKLDKEKSEKRKIYEDKYLGNEKNDEKRKIYQKEYYKNNGGKK